MIFCADLPEIAFYKPTGYQQQNTPELSMLHCNAVIHVAFLHGVRDWLRFQGARLGVTYDVNGHFTLDQVLDSKWPVSIPCPGALIGLTYT